MIGFLLGLSSASCLLAWLIWRDARMSPTELQPDLHISPQRDTLTWRPKRPYRMLR